MSFSKSSNRLSRSSRGESVSSITSSISDSGLNDEFPERSLSDHGIFVIMGSIEDSVCQEAIEWILEMNLRGGLDHLTIVINSEGGDVHAGFALIDAMSGSKIPVHTVGMGLIASMGLMIFLAGKKGSRRLTPNTLILSHQWSGVNWGKQHELLAHQKANQVVSDMVYRHYARTTGQSEKVIRQKLLPPSDVYLSPNEALELRICDEVCNL